MFHLKFEIPPSPQKIELTDSLYLMGSCFSEEIGSHLKAGKIQVQANTFGTLYNPVSIAKTICSGLSKNRSMEHQGIFYHRDAHSKISATSSADLEQLMESANRDHFKFLERTDWLILTVGTAIVYEGQEQEVVANCHKQPGDQFRKRFLSQEEVINSFESIRENVKKIRPDVRMILTVSPVRHIRDGLVHNNRSKAILIDSVHQFVEKYEDVHYFPSYEMLIDELRDYRFYKEDLIHPTEQAVFHVWQKFKETYFSQESQKILAEWENLRRALNHKPFHPDSTAHKTFLKSTLKKLEKLQDKLELSAEMEHIRQKLI